MKLRTVVPSGSGEALGVTAVLGDNVFAAAPSTALDAQDQGAVFVYTKPSSGWSGSLPAPLPRDRSSL